MTTKDYIKFAKMIRGNVEAVENGDQDENIHAMLETVAEETAQIFADDNPLFDKELFIGACGLL